MRTGIYVGIIVLFASAAGIFLVNYLKENKPVIPISNETSCSGDDECEWRITNCCPENAGAKWGCVSAKSTLETTCPKSVICPQVISPKPNKICGCVKGMCETK